MGKELIDKTGQVFNNWTVLRFDKYVGEKPSRRAYWICQCKCGAIKSIHGGSLRRGLSQSCGCKYGNPGNPKHGMCYSAEYLIWYGMKQRCYAKYHTSFNRYGARKIGVCDRWRDSFENFYEDMGPRPSPKHQLERKDNSADYSPDNCVWDIATAQARNRRSSKYVLVNGIKMTIAEAAERAGMNYKLYWKHLRKGKINNAISI